MKNSCRCCLAHKTNLNIVVDKVNPSQQTAVFGGSGLPTTLQKLALNSLTRAVIKSSRRWPRLWNSQDPNLIKHNRPSSIHGGPTRQTHTSQRIFHQHPGSQRCRYCTPPEVMSFVTTEPKSDSNLTLNHTWIWGILIRLIISALSHFLWVDPE